MGGESEESCGVTPGGDTRSPATPDTERLAKLRRLLLQIKAEWYDGATASEATTGDPVFALGNVLDLANDALGALDDVEAALRSAQKQAERLERQAESLRKDRAAVERYAHTLEREREVAQKQAEEAERRASSTTKDQAIDLLEAREATLQARIYDLWERWEPEPPEWLNELARLAGHPDVALSGDGQR